MVDQILRLGYRATIASLPTGIGRGHSGVLVVADKLAELLSIGVPPSY